MRALPMMKNSAPSRSGLLMILGRPPWWRLPTGDCSMRIAYLDCFSGISGDMFLGTLVDAGVPVRLLEETVAALAIGARVEAGRVLRSGISATKLDVITGGEKDLPREVFQAQRAAQFHDEHTDAGAMAHAHGPAAHHGHAHPHPNTRQARALGTPHRGLADIRGIIAKSAISASARQRAIAIFEALGAAEAKIHQVPVQDIHFHEVSSDDALVDIVCAAVGSEFLAVDEWVSSAVNVGGGTVECRHGRFPVPAPASLELLSMRAAPVYSSGIDKELATPTGAAILSVLASRFGPFPAMKVDRVAYGAGYRDLPQHPNVLRLTLGEAESTEATADTVTVLEANLDDVNPQVVGYVIDRALAAGALDVFTIPVQMKKSRPGLLLTILCRPADSDKLAQLMFSETTTIGVRLRQETRQCLTRRHISVETRWGTVRLKLASLNGTITNFAPEYEDCRRLAETQQIPLKTVMQEAVRLYLERHHE